MCPACEAEARGEVFDYDAVLRGIDGMIERSGQAIQFVSGTSTTPDWAYTIGRQRRGLPDLIVMGLDPRSSAELLNEADARGDELMALLATGTLEDAIDYTFVPVPERIWHTTDYLLGAANDARLLVPERRLEAMQLVWASDDGRFPWDPDADPNFQSMQVILGLLRS